MTQAAVSYQIKLLEEKLGVMLFLRRPRKVVLTEAGSRLANRTTEAFEILRDAVSAVTKHAAGTLIISSNTTFATNWLSTHIGDFQMLNPSLAVRLIPYNRDRAFGEDDTDLAIVAGNEIDTKLRSHDLIRGVCTPMLSPSLAETVGGIHEPTDLLKLPIIDPSDSWWERWFLAAGVPEPKLKREPASSLGAQMMVANRAIAGQGAAILTPFFYQDALSQGLLIQPFELVCDVCICWKLVYPEVFRNARKIRLFRDWLLPQMPDVQ
jgi:LysR family glycine cleavage system transcriptional activator